MDKKSIKNISKKTINKIDLKVEGDKLCFPYSLCLADDLSEKSFKRENPFLLFIPMDKSFPIIFFAIIKYINIAKKYHCHKENYSFNKFQEKFSLNSKVCIGDKIAILENIIDTQEKKQICLSFVDGSRFFYDSKYYKIIKHAKETLKISKSTNTKSIEIEKKWFLNKEKNGYTFLDYLKLSYGVFETSIIVVTNNKKKNKEILHNISLENTYLSDLLVVSEFDPKTKKLKYQSKKVSGNGLIFANSIDYCNEIFNIEGISVKYIFYEDYAGTNVSKDYFSMKKVINNKLCNFFVLSKISSYLNINLDKYSKLKFNYSVLGKNHNINNINFNSYLKQYNRIKLNFMKQLFLVNFCDMQQPIELLFSKEDELLQLNQKIYNLFKSSKDEGTFIFNKIKYKLFKFMEILRIYPIVESKFINNFYIDYQNLFDEFLKDSFSYNGKSDLICINKIVENLFKKYLLSDYENKKLQIIVDWGKKHSSGVIVVSDSIDEDNLEKFRQYLDEKIIKNSFRLIKESMLINEDNLFDEVLILGIPRFVKLQQILYLMKVRKIFIVINLIDAFLFNKFLVNNNTQKIISDLNSNNDTSIWLLEESKESLERFLKLGKSSSSVNLFTDDDRGKILLKTRVNEKTSDIDSDKRVDNVYMVDFSYNKYAFFLNSHNLLRINYSTFLKNSFNCKVNDLVVSDFIIMRETDFDLISTYAILLLKESGQTDLIKVSQVWKEKLQEKAFQMSISSIIYQLKRIGCKRGEATIKNWLYNSEIICPQKKEDLEKISEFCKPNSFNTDEVYYACSVIKAKHIQAGAEIQKKVKEFLSNLDYEDLIRLRDYPDFFIDGIGKIYLLRVEDINKIDNVYYKNLNKINIDN